MGDASKLVEGLEEGGTVYKGTDGDAKSYRCGKSIYGQSKLSAELNVAIDAQVEAPGHGKWWLDGKTGFDKGYLKRKMCAIVTPEAQEGAKRMQPAKWLQVGSEVKAASPAVECVRLLQDPERVDGVKSEGMRAKREGEVLVEREAPPRHLGTCAVLRHGLLGNGQLPRLKRRVGLAGATLDLAADLGFWSGEVAGVARGPLLAEEVRWFLRHGVCMCCVLLASGALRLLCFMLLCSPRKVVLWLLIWR